MNTLSNILLAQYVNVCVFVCVCAGICLYIYYVHNVSECAHALLKKESYSYTLVATHKITSSKRVCIIS